jgi:hypothetical protein
MGSFKNRKKLQANNFKNKLGLVSKKDLFNITIGRKVLLKNSNVIRVEDEENQDDFFTIKSLNEIHLDLVMEKIREKNWNHILERAYAVSIYMMLALSGIPRKKIKTMLSLLGTLHSNTAYNYVSKFINGDEEILFEENRGKYHRDTIFERIPDLSEDIKEFTINKVSEKNAKFTIDILLKFAIKKLKEYEPHINSIQTISSRALNKLITGFGFFWGKNKMRVYFNGHERVDVVDARKSFVKYFTDNRDKFYIYSKNAKDDYTWSNPRKSEARILIAHDESTFRSGDIPAEQWIHHQYSPLFNKGV